MRDSGRSYSIRRMEALGGKGVTFGFRGSSVRLATNKSRGELATNSPFKRPDRLLGLFYSKGNSRPLSLSLSRPHLNVPPRMFSSQSSFFAMKPPPVAAPSPPIEIPAVVRALFRHGGAGDRGRETRLQAAENGSRTRKPFL